MGGEKGEPEQENRATDASSHEFDLVEQETEAAEAGSLTHDTEQEMFTGQDQGKFVRFDAKPKGTSSPKPERSPMEIGQKTFDDLFADEDHCTFEGFNTDIEAFADASEMVTEDAAPHTGGGKGSSSTFHENVSVGESECDPNSTGGFDRSQLQSCSGVEPSNSQTSVDLQIVKVQRRHSQNGGRCGGTKRDTNYERGCPN